MNQSAFCIILHFEPRSFYVSLLWAG